MLTPMIITILAHFLKKFDWMHQYWYFDAQLLNVNITNTQQRTAGDSSVVLLLQIECCTAHNLIIRSRSSGTSSFWRMS